MGQCQMLMLYLHLPIQVGCIQQLNPVHPSYHRTLCPTADVYTPPHSPLCSGSLQTASQLPPRSHQLYNRLIFIVIKF